MGNAPDKTEKEISVPVDESIKLKVFEDDREQAHMKNYGTILPSQCFHTIFLFLPTGELFNVFQTCSLLHHISNTSFFWKTYFNNSVKSFGLTMKESELLVEPRNGKCQRKKNFKELYYEYCRFHYYHRDDYFRHMFMKRVDDCNLESEVVKINILLVGERHVGKTSYVNRFVCDYYNESYQDTLKRKIIYEGSIVEISFWIWNGDILVERLKNIAIHGVILCFSLVDISSFHMIDDWHNKCKEMNNGVVQKQFIVCGLKSDNMWSNYREVYDEHILKQMKALGLSSIRDYCECSGKENLHVCYPVGRILEKIFLEEDKQSNNC